MKTLQLALARKSNYNAGTAQSMIETANRKYGMKPGKSFRPAGEAERKAPIQPPKRAGTRKLSPLLANVERK